MWYLQATFFSQIDTFQEKKVIWEMRILEKENKVVMDEGTDDDNGNKKSPWIKENKKNSCVFPWLHFMA